jgi:type II secretory pathway component PulJ
VNLNSLRADRGASLLEVLIAMMIVGLLGVAIVGGLVLVRATSDRTEAKAAMLRQLTDAATDISLRPFVPCAPGTLYASPAPLNPTVIVQVTNSTGAWVACDGTNNTAASTIQKVTLRTTFSGKTYERVLMKAKG